MLILLLAALACAVNAVPLVTKPAPAFSGEAADGSAFSSVNFPKDYAGRWLVLLFYPLDFTFVCPTELIAFSDRADDFAERNAAVLGVSVDSVYTHRAWLDTPRSQGGVGKLNFPLLSDLTREISRNYGVLLDEGFATRGVFVIDDKGVLRSMTVNAPSVGRNVDEVLRLIDAFQHTDESGTVCPANWSKGDDTILPDVEGKRAFFAKTYADKQEL
ncbi:MAG: hypothetical protein MHM6MM_003266 [Cercozoa sp. M6MM]